MRRLPLIRKLVQISILMTFCALPYLALLGFNNFSGTLFSLNFFGAPFADPASTLQVLGQSLLDGAWPISEILIGAGASLILAFVMGRIFCGWICPYGLVSEFTSRKNKFWKYSFRCKIFLFALALALSFIFGWPAITLLSMPGQITLAPVGFMVSWLACLLILAPALIALTFDFILGKRFFCSTLCPQSVLLGLSAKSLPKGVPGLRINWDSRQCNCKDSLCDKACQLGLKPRKNPDRALCSMCGDCVSICSKHGGALSFGYKERRKASS